MIIFFYLSFDIICYIFLKKFNFISNIFKTILFSLFLIILLSKMNFIIYITSIHEFIDRIFEFLRILLISVI